MEEINWKNIKERIRNLENKVARLENQINSAKNSRNLNYQVLVFNCEKKGIKKKELEKVLGISRDELYIAIKHLSKNNKKLREYFDKNKTKHSYSKDISELIIKHFRDDIEVKIINI